MLVKKDKSSAATGLVAPSARGDNVARVKSAAVLGHVGKGKYDIV